MSWFSELQRKNPKLTQVGLGALLGGGLRAYGNYTPETGGDWFGQKMARGNLAPVAASALTGAVVRPKGMSAAQGAILSGGGGILGGMASDWATGGRWGAGSKALTDAAKAYPPYKRLLEKDIPVDKDGYPLYEYSTLDHKKHHLDYLSKKQGFEKQGFGGIGSLGRQSATTSGTRSMWDNIPDSVKWGGGAALLSMAAQDPEGDAEKIQGASDAAAKRPLDNVTKYEQAKSTKEINLGRALTKGEDKKLRLSFGLDRDPLIPMNTGTKENPKYARAADGGYIGKYNIGGDVAGHPLNQELYAWNTFINGEEPNDYEWAKAQERHGITPTRSETSRRAMQERAMAQYMPTESPDDLGISEYPIYVPNEYGTRSGQIGDIGDVLTSIPMPEVEPDPGFGGLTSGLGDLAEGLASGGLVSRMFENQKLKDHMEQTLKQGRIREGLTARSGQPVTSTSNTSVDSPWSYIPGMGNEVSASAQRDAGSDLMNRSIAGKSGLTQEGLEELLLRNTSAGSPWSSFVPGMGNEVSALAQRDTDSGLLNRSMAGKSGLTREELEELLLQFKGDYAYGGMAEQDFIHGGYANGPGGPRTDSIPARLSDGEFVMTAEAVNNAGGPRPMYELMHRLEDRA